MSFGDAGWFGFDLWVGLVVVSLFSLLVSLLVGACSCVMVWWCFGCVAGRITDFC